MIDPTLAQLVTLDPKMRELATILLTALREAGIPAIITALGARRGTTEQRRLVAGGRSKTLRSKHLTGHAFDIDVAGLNRDAIPREFWNIVGPWAEQNLGLRWGGRFKGFWDPGHFEI